MCCVFLSKAHRFSPFENINCVSANSSSSHSSLLLLIFYFLSFNFLSLLDSVHKFFLDLQKSCNLSFVTRSSQDFIPSYLIQAHLATTRMRAPTSSLRREFLRKWILGLEISSYSAKRMSILERKKAIKLSADIAMASARKGWTSWSRALIASASKDDNGKVFVDQILGSQCCSKRLTKIPRVRCMNILKKISSGTFNRRIMKRVPEKAVASSIAKRMVKKRIQILRRLVPGGEFMDEVSLIEETLDYILSLRAQIDVMRSLADATEMMVSCKKDQW